MHTWPVVIYLSIRLFNRLFYAPALNNINGNECAYYVFARLLFTAYKKFSCYQILKSNKTELRWAPWDVFQFYISFRSSPIYILPLPIFLVLNSTHIIHFTSSQRISFPIMKEELVVQS